MKYFSELSKIESEIIRLDTLKSLVRVLTAGADQSNQQDLMNSLYLVDETLENIHDRLRESFNEMWEKDREDSFKEKKGKKNDGAM